MEHTLIYMYIYTHIWMIHLTCIYTQLIMFTGWIGGEGGEEIGEWEVGNEIKKTTGTGSGHWIEIGM